MCRNFDDRHDTASNENRKGTKGGRAGAQGEPMTANDGTGDQVQTIGGRRHSVMIQYKSRVGARSWPVFVLCVGGLRYMSVCRRKKEKFDRRKQRPYIIRHAVIDHPQVPRTINHIHSLLPTHSQSLLSLTILPDWRIPAAKQRQRMRGGKELE
jgi:hypothetical protein